MAQPDFVVEFCRRLRAVLAELPTKADIPPSPENNYPALERIIPEVLAQVHHEWRHESLDGILPLTERKTNDLEIELCGHCILISDQTLVPLRLQLALSPSKDEIAWMELRLGQIGRDGTMIRTPYRTDNLKLGAALKPEIRWAYHVGFGDRPAQT